MGALSLVEFADRLNELMPILLKEFVRRQSDELFRGRITLPQFLILAYLLRHEESKMTELARLMGVTTAAMTGAVDRLVRENFVMRAHDPLDRRIIKIKLTFKGQGLVRRITEQRRRMVTNVFGKLPEADRREYLRILTEIKDIVIKEDLKLK